jgi:hypothetical protein
MESLQHLSRNVVKSGAFQGRCFSDLSYEDLRKVAKRYSDRDLQLYAKALLALVDTNSIGGNGAVGVTTAPSSLNVNRTGEPQRANSSLVCTLATRNQIPRLQGRQGGSGRMQYDAWSVMLFMATWTKCLVQTCRRFGMGILVFLAVIVIFPGIMKFPARVCSFAIRVCADRFLQAGSEFFDEFFHLTFGGVHTTTTMPPPTSPPVDCGKPPSWKDSFTTFFSGVGVALMLTLTRGTNTR